MDYSRTTFRNNNEYKISKKLTLNQNFSFGITKSKPLLLRMLTSNHLLFLFVFNWTIWRVICWKRWFAGTTGSLLTMWVIQLRN
jgi:hypothetical protein